jgi:cobalamin biosynthesis Mg chelatase CobN
VGGNRTLRVVMHLYASRQRQQQELENLCADCDDTKLGIVLSNTTADLLAQYHKGAQAMDQLAALLDATPAGLQDRSQTAAADASQAQTAQAAPPTQSSDAAQGAPPPTAQAPTPPTATPPPGPLAQGSTLPATPGAYPTPLPPAPVLSGNEPLTSGRTTTQKPGRSVQRKAIAGVLGALGFGTLVGSLVLNILDMHIASNHSYNPAGSPCIDPQYAGQYCVYSTIRLWAPGYAVGGLLVGGMILTLALPEHGR